MLVLLDIPYSSLERTSQFDLYIPPAATSSSPLLSFVHGGAWATEDKADHATLAKHIALYTGYPVAVPNYRLTPRQAQEDGATLHHHPEHAQDVLLFLEFLLAWDGPSRTGRPYDPTKLFLMGHSCGAHMLSSVFLDSSKITPTLAPSPALLDAVHAIVLSQGIYDLDMLISRFPTYLEWFIVPAFGKLQSYAPFSVTTYPLRRLAIKWLIIHSQGDTLVDRSQSEHMCTHLKSEYSPIADSHVFYDTSLTQEHDDILATGEFVRIVGQFVQGVFKKDIVSTSIVVLP